MFKFWKHFEPHFGVNPSSIVEHNYRDKRNIFSEESNVIYFWGFYLGEEVPKSFSCEIERITFWKKVKSHEIIIYYIGKKNRNDTERLLQHFSHLFGGYYTIVEWDYLKNHNQCARLKLLELLWEKSKDLNVNAKKGITDLILHTSDSHSALRNFHNRKSNKLQRTLSEMKDRLIFDSIYDAGSNFENDIHEWVSLNILGVGQRKKMIFHKNINVENHNVINKIYCHNSLLAQWILDVIKWHPIGNEEKYIGSCIDVDYFKIGKKKKFRGFCCNVEECKNSKVKLHKVEKRWWRKAGGSSKQNMSTPSGTEPSDVYYCDNCYSAFTSNLVGSHIPRNFPNK
jgi:hypothetical protein